LLAGPPGAAPGPVLDLTGPATVRARAPGDRVCLEGVARPVTRVLRRAGVPGLLRDLAPVVVEADGRLAGVVGVVAADAAPSAPWRAWAEPVAP
jgi:tRNA(Ile)-lysidine synthetase-like protein